MTFRDYWQRVLRRFFIRIRISLRKTLKQLRDEKGLFALHSLPLLFTGYELTIVTHSRHFNGALADFTQECIIFCWSYLVFRITAIFGGILTIAVIPRISLHQLLFVASACQLLTSYLASLCSEIHLFIILYSISGFFTGLIITATIISMLCIQNELGAHLLHILLFFSSVGSLIGLSTLKVENSRISEQHFSNTTKQHFFVGCYENDILIGSRLSSRLSFFIIFVTQAIGICYSHFYHKNSNPSAVLVLIERTPEIKNRKRLSRYWRIITLSTLLIVVVNALSLGIPHYLLGISYKRGTDPLFPIYLFHGSTAAGCILSCILSSVASANTLIGIGLFGYGIASCIFVYDNLFLFGTILCGFLLSALGANIFLHVLKVEGSKIYGVYAICCGSLFGAMLYPAVISEIFVKLGSRFFVALNFIAILLMVLLFVSIMDIQTEVESNLGHNSKTFVWSFLSGRSISNRSSLRSRVQRLSKRLVHIRSGVKLTSYAIGRFQSSSLKEPFTKFRPPYRNQMKKEEEMLVQLHVGTSKADVHLIPDESFTSTS